MNPINFQRYFDPSLVNIRIQASNDALDAFHRNDIPAFYKSLTAFAMSLDGVSYPAWAGSIVVLTDKAGKQRLINLNSFYGKTVNEIIEEIS